MDERFEIGAGVRTLKSVNPQGYAAGARDGNQWGVQGWVVEEVSGHGLCYKVLHNGTYGWYEPNELMAISRKPAIEVNSVQTIWDHLRND